eukprot:5322288-Pyramimonas_sp.AAC.1
MGIAQDSCHHCLLPTAGQTKFGSSPLDESIVKQTNTARPHVAASSSIHRRCGHVPRPHLPWPRVGGPQRNR